MAEVVTQQGASKLTRRSREREVETIRNLMADAFEKYDPPSDLLMGDVSVTGTSSSSSSSTPVEKIREVYSNNTGDSNYKALTLSGSDYYFDTSINFSEYTTARIVYLILGGRWFILDDGDGGDFTIADNGSGLIRVTITAPPANPFPQNTGGIPKMYMEFTLFG